MFVLTATDLPRFMQCNGSRNFPILNREPVENSDAIDKPVESSDISVRDDGIAAHWLAQKIHYGDIGENLLNQKAPNGVYVTRGMLDFVSNYVVNLNERNSIGEMEKNLHFGESGWLVICRPDHICHDPETDILYVDDFKYGFGIVEPENNWSLIAYALAYCIQFEIAPNQIVFTIFQPRASHYRGPKRDWTIDYPTLLDFYKTLSETISEPSDVLTTGAACRHCPALSVCPAATKTAWLAIDESERFISEDISNAELALNIEIFTAALNRLNNKLSAFQDLAFNRIKQGQIIDGYCISHDLANTKWKDFVTVDLLKMLTGKDLTTGALITPKQAKEIIAPDIVDRLTERPKKKPTLKKVETNKRANAILNKQG